MASGGTNLAMMGPIRAAPVLVTGPRASVALNAGQQGKHIPGHNNYIQGRSVLTHKDPPKLLNDFAGTGQRAGGTAGQPGYRERVNFGTEIGQYVDQKTGAATPTTNGIIHYGSDGAHIVPARPSP
jgi:filamentous hemagglutinin